MQTPPEKSPFGPGFGLFRESAIEKLWQPQWDRVTVTAPGRYEFFQRPIGTGGRKALAETSMYMAGQIPRGNTFYLTGLGVYALPDRTLPRRSQLDDLVQLLGGGTVQLRIGSRHYYAMAPLAACPPRFPMYWAYDDERLEKTLIKRDIPYLSKGEELTPLFIPPHQNFAVEIELPQALQLSGPAVLGVTLDGYMFREAQ